MDGTFGCRCNNRTLPHKYNYSKGTLYPILGKNVNSPNPCPTQGLRERSLPVEVRLLTHANGMPNLRGESLAFAPTLSRLDMEVIIRCGGLDAVRGYSLLTSIRDRVRIELTRSVACIISVRYDGFAFSTSLKTRTSKAK